MSSALIAKWATWPAGRFGGAGIGNLSFPVGRKTLGTASRYAFRGLRVNPILPADVEIAPTRGAAGEDLLGPLGGALRLAGPGERMGPAPLRLARHADG